jgi:hypothetical protein
MENMMSRSLQARQHRVVKLSAESLVCDPRVIGQHNLSAIDLAAGVLTPFGRTPEEIEFVQFMIGIISASPDHRTMSKSEQIEVGITRFHLSRRRASSLRERVIDQLDARAWATAGARRRNRR